VVRRLTSRGALTLIAAIAVSLAAVAAGSAKTAKTSEAASAASASSSKCWTVAQVKKATGSHDVIPIYCVPKKVKNYLLAFINPDLSNPYFKAWEDGMKAAAAFYKVRFIDANAQNNYDSETALYQTLNAQHPDAVGAHPGNDVIAEEALANHQPFTTIDGYGGTKNLVGGIGVPDKQAGQLAASLLAPWIKAKLAGPWKGKQLYFLGLGVPGCAPCQIRPQVALATLTSQFKVKFAGNAFTPQYADPNFGQSWMTDQMTAHPDGRFVIVPLNDESLIGVLQALKDAGKLSNALAVTLGYDPTGASYLNTYPKTVPAAVDFNPYSEGWNWVVASIARLKHAHYSQYKLAKTVTVGKP
jgi:ABC-type sugar transport system substrate-binding protein